MAFNKLEKQCFTLELMLATNHNDDLLFSKRFRYGEKIYNQLVRYARKQYNKLIRDKRYKDAKGKNRTELVKEYCLDRSGVYKYAKVIGRKYKKHLDSKVVQCLANRLLKSINKLLYEDGEYIHFKKFGTLTTLEGNTNFNRLKIKNIKYQLLYYYFIFYKQKTPDLQVLFNFLKNYFLLKLKFFLLNHQRSGLSS